MTKADPSLEVERLCKLAKRYHLYSTVSFVLRAVAIGLAIALFPYSLTISINMVIVAVTCNYINTVFTLHARHAQDKAIELIEAMALIADHM